MHTPRASRLSLAIAHSILVHIPESTFRVVPTLPFYRSKISISLDKSSTHPFYSTESTGSSLSCQSKKISQR